MAVLTLHAHSIIFRRYMTSKLLNALYGTALSEKKRPKMIDMAHKNSFNG
jgi:hypothetical protein